MVKMSNRINRYLDELYHGVHECSDAASLCSAFSNIVQIKHEHQEMADYNEPLYVDIKNFIDNYVCMVSSPNRDFGYDAVDSHKMEQFISFCLDLRQRNELYHFAYIQLSAKGLTSDAEYFENMYRKGSAIAQIRNGNFFQKLVGIVSFTVSSTWLCLLVLGVVLLIHYVILLPCSSPDNALFEISHAAYADNFYVNHLLNLFMYLLGINETLFCKPIHSTGTILILCLQLFYVLFVGGLFVDMLKEKLI